MAHKCHKICLLTNVIKSVYSQIIVYYERYQGFPGGSDGKESASSAGGLIPGLGRSLEEGNGNPLQYSGLENFMDRGVAKSKT